MYQHKETILSKSIYPRTIHVAKTDRTISFISKTLNTYKDIYLLLVFSALLSQQIVGKLHEDIADVFDSLYLKADIWKPL